MIISLRELHNNLCDHLKNDITNSLDAWDYSSSKDLLEKAITSYKYLRFTAKAIVIFAICVFDTILRSPVSIYKREMRENTRFLRKDATLIKNLAIRIIVN